MTNQREFRYKGEFMKLWRKLGLLAITALIMGCNDDPTKPPVPTVTRLVISPTAQLFAETNELHTLTLKALDSTGTEVTLEDSAIEWVNSANDVISITQSGMNADAKASAKIGTAVVTARLKNDPTITTAPAFLSRVTVAPGTRLLPDADILISTAPNSLVAIPEVTDPTGTPGVAGFTRDEIKAFLTVVDGNLRVPAILRRTDLQIGALLTASQSGHLAGRITNQIVRGNRVLVQLESVSADELFGDFAFDLDSNIIKTIKLGKNLVTSTRNTRVSDDCSKVDLTVLSAKSDFAGLDVGVEHASYKKGSLKLILSYKGKLGVDLSITSQLSLAYKRDCALKDEISKSLPLPGPLGFLISSKVSLQPKLGISFEGSAGPSVTVGFKTSVNIDGHIVMCFPSCSEQSTATLTPDVSGTLGASTDEETKLAATVELFLESKVGFLIGGPAFKEGCSFIKLLFFGFENQCEDLLASATLNVLKGKLSGKFSATWESPKRVVTNKESKSGIGTSLDVGLEIDTEQINKLAKFLKFTDLKLNLFTGSLAGPTFYRVFGYKSGTVKVTGSDGTEKKNIAFSEAQSVSAAVGDTTELTFNADYKPENPILTFLDTPLDTGLVYKDGVAYDIPGLTVTPNGKTITFKFPVEQVMCDSTLTFLGSNKMFATLSTAGYMGSIALSCPPLQYKGDYSLSTSAVNNGQTESITFSGPISVKILGNGDTTVTVTRHEAWSGSYVFQFDWTDEIFTKATISPTGVISFSFSVPYWGNGSLSGMLSGSDKNLSGQYTIHYTYGGWDFTMSGQINLVKIE